MKKYLLLIAVLFIITFLQAQNELKYAKAIVNSCAGILDKYTSYGNITTHAYPGETVKVFACVGSYYKVEYKNINGYIPFDEVIMNDDLLLFLKPSINPRKYANIKEKYGEQTRLNNVRQKELEELRKKSIKKELDYQKRIESDQAVRKTNLIAKYGSNIGTKLSHYEYWIGMSKQMVLDSFGQPIKQKRILTADFDYEEWIYHDLYLQLENDKVTTIIN